MKHIYKIKAFSISCLLFSGSTLADDNKSIGVGVGSMYNGLGVSYGLLESNSYKYASIGCLSLSNSDSRGTETNCGIGFGYITTALISKTENNHGLGIHIGVTYNEHKNLDEYEAFISPQYVYFFNGINSSGMNLGVNAWSGKRDGESDNGFGFQIGRQFK
jgi:hypothetical protein